jgi:CRISPR/Cas system CSM-associated protein Csm2 small subunit
LTPDEVEEMIIDNKEIVEKRGQPFAVDIEILSEIIEQVNSFDNIQDKRERIIKKVAHLLGGIAYHQLLMKVIKRLQYHGLFIFCVEMDSIY